MLKLEKFSKVKPARGVINAIKNSDAVIIGPSNPITSILPILNLDGVREALKDTYVVAVSPFVGGDAVSGPASKFMNALDFESSALGVGELYKDFLDEIIIDKIDENLFESLNEIVNKVSITNTIMNDLEAKKFLAKKVIENISKIENGG